MIVEGTPPGRFAVEHAHYTADLPFWTALAHEAGSPVLDLAAAVGRVALPLARDGHEVWALDGSDGMLAELRAALEGETDEVRSRVHPVRADMRDFSLGRTFPLAIMPMNSLQTLLERDEQLACLTAVRGHLDPLGEFAFDLILADLDAVARNLGAVQAGATWHDDTSGATLNHSAWFDAADPATGTVTFTTRIDEIAPGGEERTHLRPQTVHLFTPTEVWELAVDAGLEMRAVYGDFDGRPLEPDAERQIYRCGVAA